MKRTSLFIDEQLERELRALARRVKRPAAALVREAVEQYVVAARAERTGGLGFVAVGRSGRADTAERHEELLWREPVPPRSSSPRPARSRARRKS